MANEKFNTECHELAYEVLKSTASWLEDPDNEILSLLDEHDPSVDLAAKACVVAANILRQASLEIQIVSGVPETQQNIGVALDKLRVLADEFDSSGDPNLIKKAGLLDEILLTVAADIEEQTKFQERRMKKMDAIKKRSQEQAVAKVATEPASKSSDAQQVRQAKTYEGNEAPKSTRYCPDHPGVPSYPVKDGVVKCSLDGKVYDFNEGFTTANGNKVPGTSVQNQTLLDTHITNPLVVEKTRGQD